MRNMDQLAHDLAVRLGFGAQRGASIIQRPLLFSALKSAQRQLYEEFGQELLKVVNEWDPGLLIRGQALYDFPADCDPLRITAVSVCHANRYYEIDRGISTLRRSRTEMCATHMDDMPKNTCGEPSTPDPVVGDIWSRPTRWDMRLSEDQNPHVPAPQVEGHTAAPEDNPNSHHGDTRVGQLEFWPIPNSNYPVRLEYYRKMLKFEDNLDKPSIDDELIFLHALVNLKAHYRQPDGQNYAGQLATLLGRIKSRQLAGLRFNKLRQRYRTGPRPPYSPGFERDYQPGVMIVGQNTVDTENEDYVPVITEDSSDGP